ncbi:hypothetical protein C9374_012664 [Naegleria lovaniensis]|uniref:Uncharacterized protein n=1 Tax=Naegleria lovaniensis TaxID=51637 RepID=A0AA88H3I6_NAELO|nr:uncharacterized protein C9374_012664 [Naegleria lovaniensis]KAG2392412.1 hypothetical protein C9374_012664 [Naegleria lovaniensis]
MASQVYHDVSTLSAATSTMTNDDEEVRSPSSPFYNLRNEQKFITAAEYKDSQDYQDELHTSHDDQMIVYDEDPFGIPKDPFEEDSNEDILDYQDYPEDKYDDDHHEDEERFENELYHHDDDTRLDTSRTKSIYSGGLEDSFIRTAVLSPTGSVTSTFSTRSSRLRRISGYEPLLTPQSVSEKRKSSRLSVSTLLPPDVERKDVVAGLIPSLHVALFIIVLMLAIVFYSSELHYIIKPAVRFISRLLRRLNVKVWTEFDELEL